MSSMIHLRELSLDVPEASVEAYPFAIPTIRTLDALSFDQPVTFLVGENGSGKSTLLEALAWACECVTVGSAPIERDPSLAPVLPLARALRLVWNRKPKRGFFLRAEDFFGYVKQVKDDIGELQRRAGEVRAERPELPEGEIARITAPFAGSALSLIHI